MIKKLAGFIFVLFLLGILAFVYLVYFVDTRAYDIQNYLSSLGLNSTYVNVSGNNIHVYFDSIAVDKYPKIMGNIYSYIKSNYNFSNISIYAYLSGEPVLRFDGTKYTDIRNDRFKVMSDLWNFDVIVDDVKISNETTHIYLEYLADEDGFWKDFYGMSFIAYEDTPWVNQIQITYLSNSSNESNKTISISTDKLSALFSGKISSQELAKVTIIK